MPILDFDPGQSPEAAGTLYFYKQGSDPSTGFQVTTEGAMPAVTVGGMVLPTGDSVPQDHGLETWTHDPYNGASSALLVNGRIYLVRMNVRRAATVSTVWWSIATPGATPTAGQNWVGLYSSSGARLATTNVDASVAGSGAQATAITPQSLAAGTFVWAAFVFNAATPPTVVRGASFESTPNVNLPATALRSAVNGSGTTLPASITPGSNTTSNAITLFSALS